MPQNLFQCFRSNGADVPLYGAHKAKIQPQMGGGGGGFFTQLPHQRYQIPILQRQRLFAGQTGCHGEVIYQSQQLIVVLIQLSCPPVEGGILLSCGGGNQLIGGKVKGGQRIPDLGGYAGKQGYQVIAFRFHEKLLSGAKALSIAFAVK
jgi:hypothetical protein